MLQQNVALLSWIGWNILWGIGAIIGRRRTYIVHRTVHRDAAPAERQSRAFKNVNHTTAAASAASLSGAST